MLISVDAAGFQPLPRHTQLTPKQKWLTGSLPGVVRGFFGCPFHFIHMHVQTIIGMDISAYWVDVVVLREKLSIAPRDFFESKKFKDCHHRIECNADGINFIKSMSPAMIVLETTGSYSRFWINSFEANGLAYLIANQTMLRDTRKAFAGSDNKSDAFDALLLAHLYFIYYQDCYDRRYWVKDRHPTIKLIRRLLLDLKSIVRKRTADINYTKQRLASEYPAKADVHSRRPNGQLDPDIPPAFWAWVANWQSDKWNMTPRVVARFENQYRNAIEKGEGTGFSDLTRQYAKLICSHHVSEAMVERELLPLVRNEMFGEYHKIFDSFAFGDRERAWLLVRIYPFADYLALPRNRALRRFRQALGVGKIERSSGKSSGRAAKNTGSSELRSILWTYVNYRIEKGLEKSFSSEGSPQTNVRDSCPDTPVCKELRAYFIDRAFTNNRKIKGRALSDARNATCRKLAELVFREMWRSRVK